MGWRDISVFRMELELQHPRRVARDRPGASRSDAALGQPFVCTGVLTPRQGDRSTEAPAPAYRLAMTIISPSASIGVSASISTTPGGAEKRCARSSTSALTAKIATATQALIIP